MTSSRILLLGSSGFLGSNVANALAEQGSASLTLHVSSGDAPNVPGAVVKADLTDSDSVARILRATRPDLIINCAALADVDACEAMPDLAAALNHHLPAQLGAYASATGARFVHVSTDAVFAGDAEAYTEESVVSPVNVYGRTKRDGEVAVALADPEALIARTNIVGWSPSGRRSLLEYFYNRLSRSESAPGYTDLTFRPLPVQRFWPICSHLLGSGGTGVAHVTGPELLSKYEFGRRVAAVFGFDPGLVIPTESSFDRARAPRAAHLDVRPSRLIGELFGGPESTLVGGLRQLRESRARRGIPADHTGMSAAQQETQR